MERTPPLHIQRQTLSQLLPVKMRTIVRQRTGARLYCSPRAIGYTVFLYFLLHLVYSSDREVVVGPRGYFTIVVLTMNRTKSLMGLLQSLQATDFLGDTVALEVHVDKGDNFEETLHAAASYDFQHGSTVVRLSNRSLGLAESWFRAFQPIRNDDRFIILEDDITLSPYWYAWLKRAWLHYGNLDGLAGISLQGQNLVPIEPAYKTRLKDRKNPFLYSLVGSIAFAPHPTIWLEFLEWVSKLESTENDIYIPGLVTSAWWASGDHRNMWTQYFIYFCFKRNLYTLYVTESTTFALASHHRRKGVHFTTDAGADYRTSNHIPTRFPIKLKKYGWDGRAEGENGFSDVVGNLHTNELIRSARKIMEKNSFVYLLFLNEGFIEHTMNWICNIESVAPEILESTMFVSADFSTTRALLHFRNMLHTFTKPSAWTEAAPFGTFNYYRIVTERLEVENVLVQAGVNIQIIEADHIWSRSLNEKLGQLMQEHMIVAGDETSFTGQDLKKICGGFYGIASTAQTRRVFQAYLDDYKAYLDKFKGYAGIKSGRIPHFEDDQLFLSRITRENNLDVHWLGPCEYANGYWFESKSYQEKCPEPAILHNNFIVGSAQKARRASFIRKWYLSQRNKCENINKPTRHRKYT